MADAFMALSKELKGLAAELRKVERAEKAQAKPRTRKVAGKTALGAVRKTTTRKRKATSKGSMPEWLPWVAGFAIAGGAVYYFTARGKSNTPDQAPELAPVTLPSAPITAPTAPSAPTAPVATVLGQGMRGAGVSALQNILVAAGYGAPLGTAGVDGDWGNATTNALTAFMRWHMGNFFQRQGIQSPPAVKPQTTLPLEVSLPLLRRVLGTSYTEAQLTPIARQLTAGTLRWPIQASSFKLF